MAAIDSHFSTGLAGLDRILKGMMPGDNVVWQVSDVEDYRRFVQPYVQRALQTEEPVTYFRFARHEPLIDDGTPGVQVDPLHPEEGFEAFIAGIHGRIEANGRGGCYLFDCLSDLAVDWYSDHMLGNFFMLTCPYLFDVESLAYFALLKNHHSFHATRPIWETTQILLDVYGYKGRTYLHPLKVQHRYSPTMHTLHVWEGDSDFKPVTRSATISEVLTSVRWAGLGTATQQEGVWDRAFLAAEDLRDNPEAFPDAERGEVYDRLARMAISRDEPVLQLARKYISLDDLLRIRGRMIGTGLIGGKSVGMLLARAVLEQDQPRWRERLEPHDSFFIGSDVFYTFLVRNGIWWARQSQRDPETFLKGAERARQRMLMGTFPDYIEKQFEDMLDYFGQSPMIVRSSSLLEDNFGNSFAGKYDSVFCVNQGPRHRRLDDFLSAVKTVYASAMSEKALKYRYQRGLLDKDEQMALLVQRVSGSVFDKLFYPQIAGVGFSFNPYVWSEEIDPDAGLLRLVFGLGTRAVDRSDDDYTRVVSLSDPNRRPEKNVDEVRQYTQRRVDYLDLEANHLDDGTFASVVRKSPDLDLEMFASRDEAIARRAKERGIEGACPWVLTFDKLLNETSFIPDMAEMMDVLEKAYDYPVDVEFTANFVEDGGFRVNLVQCRPFQVKGGGNHIELPEVAEADRILEARGAVIGQSWVTDLDRLIYVVPSVYGHLPVSDRYQVARLIGRLTHAHGKRDAKTIMLLGPGRWGTTTPSLGVPISFSEINTVSALVEIVAMREDLVPDVSLGTHLFSELVEMDILYMALFPHRGGNHLATEFFETAPNKLAELLPDEADWAECVRVIDPADLPDGRAVRLHANTLEQRAVTYLADGKKD